jgi:hypothetical protein
MLLVMEPLLVMVFALLLFGAIVRTPPLMVYVPVKGPVMVPLLVVMVVPLAIVSVPLVSVEPVVPLPTDRVPLLMLVTPE